MAEQESKRRRGWPVWGFLKGLFLIIFLLSIIVGSFWFSYSLGRKILSPVDVLLEDNNSAKKSEPLTKNLNREELDALANRLLEESQQSRHGGVIFDDQLILDNEIQPSSLIDPERNEKSEKNIER